MPQLKCVRQDLLLTIERERDGGLLCQITGDGTFRALTLEPTKADELLGLLPAETIRRLAQSLSVSVVVQEWYNRVWTLPDATTKFHRFTLQIADSNLVSLPWETVLKELWPTLELPIVRVSPVRPRAAAIDLTLPVRILQVQPAPTHDIAGALGDVFGSTPQEVVDNVMSIKQCSFAQLSDPSLFVGVPTFEVVHFDDLPTLDTPTTLLSTASPEVSGTLGWTLRFADSRQARLIVINCADPQRMEAARRLGSAITAKAGPAVLVVSVPAPQAHWFFKEWYDSLVHDFPIDKALPSLPLGTDYSIFAGGGREELLRVSEIGVNLMEVEHEIALTSVMTVPAEPAFELALQSAGGTEMVDFEMAQQYRQWWTVTAAPRQAEVHDAIKEFRRTWNDLEFESHERDGLLPVARTLKTVRDLSGLNVSVAPMRERAAQSDAPRYVNSSLWSEGATGQLEKLEQATARLTNGKLVHLGIQIGPKDITIKTIGATAVLEEFFKWTPDLKGVWLEIGITGLDFAVVGDPVQEIWLPRSGASEMVYFAVIPQLSGAARLRFCLYQKQDIIQSFRFAASVSDETASDPLEPSRRMALAAALDVKPEEVGTARYFSRLEYSVTESVRGFFKERPKRKVSIVANDLNGKSVITVKGEDAYSVEVNATLPTLVDNVREALSKIATNQKPLPHYAFGDGENNSGTEPQLGDALRELAEVGSSLYAQIIPGSERPKLNAALEEQDQIIHVAHILLEKVIPWAVIYDHEYDSDRKKDHDGHPVAHATCFAAVPDEEGKLPATLCRKHPKCLLHPDNIDAREKAGQPRYREDTVVCPLHFWGFKHVIEIPPQQAKGGSAPHSALADTIDASAQPNLDAGYNAQLRLAKPHFEALEKLTEQPNLAVVWKSKEPDRDKILFRLEADDPDIIYFYCHARGGAADPKVDPPILEFQENPPPAPPGAIKPRHFFHQNRWTHRPLVFLNGCGTAAFSPDALSPFITTLVRDRGAAGVIGTEMTVWEQLAGKAALKFFEKFLAEKTAGQSLLYLRRWLLAQNNPLGLAYTLYASADLKLKRNGPTPERIDR